MQNSARSTFANTDCFVFHEQILLFISFYSFLHRKHAFVINACCNLLTQLLLFCIRNNDKAISTKHIYPNNVQIKNQQNEIGLKNVLIRLHSLAENTAKSYNHINGHRTEQNAHNKTTRFMYTEPTGLQMICFAI